ncbi:MAG: hypothetical protein ABIW76_07555 [Fibrobacteria bacterium]
MINMMDKKTFNKIREGVTEGMDQAWLEARKQAGRVGFRSPLTYKRPSGASPWIIALLIVSASAAVAAAFYYFRSRSSVPAGGKERVGDASAMNADGYVREGQPSVVR